MFYGWKLLFVFWLVLLVAAAFPLYGGGVMNAYMATDLRLERSVVGLPMSVYQFTFGLGAPLVGLLVERFGIRRDADRRIAADGGRSAAHGAGRRRVR